MRQSGTSFLSLRKTFLQTLTFDSKIKRSCPGDVSNCHRPLIATRVRVTELGKVGLFAQFSIILK